MKKILAFVKKEIVFCAAFLLALISSFFVHPSSDYFSYIDWNTLFILFALMAVIQGLDRCGIFSSLGHALCGRFHTLRSLSAALVFLCFFTSMLITNDVALLTFVPFSLALLLDIAPKKTLAYVIVLQTLAANTGSMLTPLGNPQNLFLFSQAYLSLKDFLLVMLPYTSMSALALIVSLFFVPSTPIVFRDVLRQAQQADAQAQQADNDDDLSNKELNASMDKKENVSDNKYPAESKSPAKERPLLVRKIFCFLLFVVCLLSVLHLLPKWVAAASVLLVMLIIDRASLLKVDYMLLLTFTAFFVFTGNISRIPEISDALRKIVGGNEFASSVIASQVISNVPCTLLLYPFIKSVKNLIVGVNVGGLGTLVASLASLISFKLFSAVNEKMRLSSGKFLLIFTLSNIGMLVILCLLFVFWGGRL